MKRRSIEYWLKARAYPSVLALIPTVLLVNIFVRFDSTGVLASLGTQKIFAAIGIPAAMFVFIAQVNRIVGKEVFEKLIFKSETNFPTTQLLLFSNPVYSEEYKTKIRQKAEADFGLPLLTKPQEAADLNAAKRKIIECVGLIRRKIGDSDLLFQHNVEYGFIRNLVGGSILAAIVSIIDFLIAWILGLPKMFLGISALLFIFYSAILLLSKWLMNRYGHLYAKQMYQEYIHAN